MGAKDRGEEEDKGGATEEEAAERAEGLEGKTGGHLQLEAEIER